MPSETDDEDRANISRAIERRRQQGEPLIAVTTGKGAKIAGNVWGIAWQHHLEGYADYHSRLPRGRTVLRQGKVFDLIIRPGVVTAVVAGPALYDVTVKIKPLPDDRWQDLRDGCAGQIGSLLGLLEGRLGGAVMQRLTDPDAGLFPASKEIKVICTCPDDADLCPHGAAVLYGIGLQFDSDPSLFFQLRDVDPTTLFQQAHDAVVAPASDGGASHVIADDDLADVFGIDLGTSEK
jgi:uncharacterized Zn finger protein